MDKLAEIEAELRRLAVKAADLEDQTEQMLDNALGLISRGRYRAYTHAADLVRDAAKGDLK